MSLRGNVANQEPVANLLVRAGDPIASDPRDPAAASR